MEDATSTRKIGKLLLLVALLAIAALGAALGSPLLAKRDPEPATPPRHGAERPAAPSADSTTAPDIADEAAFVAARVEAGQWPVPIESVRVATVLRRPVIEVVTGIEGEDPASGENLATQLHAFALALETPGGRPPTFCIQVLSAEGELLATTMSTDDRWRLDAPPAPTDAVALQSWLEAVYGPGTGQAEDWYCHVLEIRNPSSDPDGYVTIATDLSPEHEGDLAAAQRIVWAVDSSGATFAPGIRIRFADPSFEWTALLAGRDLFAQ